MGEENNLARFRLARNCGLAQNGLSYAPDTLSA